MRKINLINSINKKSSVTPENGLTTQVSDMNGLSCEHNTISTNLIQTHVDDYCYECDSHVDGNCIDKVFPYMEKKLLSDTKKRAYKQWVTTQNLTCLIESNNRNESNHRSLPGSPGCF